MATDFFKKFVDDLGDPDTTLAAEGKSSAEFTGFIDTGSYTLNAIVSGSIFGGMPNNKGIVLAGDPSTGKTFFQLAIIKHFLDTHPDARAFLFDTESAITNQMLKDRGIDVNRVAKSEPDTLETFKVTCSKLLDKYAEIPADERFPMMIVLDSLSMLPSVKEVADTTEGNNTKDMTKPGVIKGIFRVLRLKMAKLQVPYIVTTHTYAIIGAYVPTKELAGGSGAKYAADTIVMLSKKKDKDADKLVIGNIVHLNAAKSRMSREDSKADTRIQHHGGLDRYYGLLDYAVEAGIFKKLGSRYEMPDGSKVFEKNIQANPTKYYTNDVLKRLDEYMKPLFSYLPGEELKGDDDDESAE